MGKLICGNAIEELRLMDDESVDLIVTDPPYRTISGGSGLTSKMHRRPAGMLSKNDGKIFTENDVQFSDYLPQLFRVLRDRSHMYLMVNFLNLEEAMSEIRKAGFQIHNLLVWHKNNATPNRWYMKNVEYVIFARKGAAKAVNNKSSMTCHKFNNLCGRKTHPTEKPVDLLRFYIENSSNEGDVVLDPFMGTGSCGEAAILSGRRFIGIELDTDYYRIAENRLSALP
jgi:site-specific DNA-methyltransferase (adenine-specific)